MLQPQAPFRHSGVLKIVIIEGDFMFSSLGVIAMSMHINFLDGFSPFDACSGLSLQERHIETVSGWAWPCCAWLQFSTLLFHGIPGAHADLQEFALGPGWPQWFCGHLREARQFSHMLPA